MKPRVFNQSKTAALTREEVLAIVVTLALLVALMLARSAASKKAMRMACLNNLKQVGLAFRLWENDHTRLYPMSVSTNFGGTLEYVEHGEAFRHFQVMSNELSTPYILICPADARLDFRHHAPDFWSTFGNTNISYFVGVDADETKPQRLLSGDRNIIAGGTKLRNGIFAITTNQSVRWSSELLHGCGNIVFADGSVQQTTSSDLRKLIRQTGQATNRLAIP
jgi:prepilin-type processing-associated H-X9-DG protein